MDVSKIVEYMHKQIDKVFPVHSSFCPVRHALDNHKEGSALLAACGQNTEELDRAIAATEKEFKNLKTVRERALVRFKVLNRHFLPTTDEIKCKEAKAEGMCSSTTDELKHKEAKVARLE